MLLFCCNKEASLSSSPSIFIHRVNSLCPNSGPRQRTRRLFSTRGVTLVELMISTLLFSIVSLATLSTLLTAYRISATVRYRDQARFVLATACDQFLRASITDSSGPSTRPFFTVTEVGGVPTPTGVGLSWYGDRQTFVITPPTSAPLYALCTSNGAVGDANGMVFQLAANTPVPVSAKLMRLVRAVDPTTGDVISGQPTPTTAGYLLRGDFTISFQFQNQTFVESNTVLRSVK